MNLVLIRGGTRYVWFRDIMLRLSSFLSTANRFSNEMSQWCNRVRQGPRLRVKQSNQLLYLFRFSCCFLRWLCWLDRRKSQIRLCHSVRNDVFFLFQTLNESPEIRMSLHNTCGKASILCWNKDDERLRISSLMIFRWRSFTFCEVVRPPCFLIDRPCCRLKMIQPFILEIRNEWC